MTTECRIVEGRFSRWMQARGWTGVTLPLPWKVLVLYWGPPSLATIRHEFVHVNQAKRWGVLGFWWRYAWGLRHGYRLNPLEVEAYNREGDA